ncbi:MAG: ATP-binding protein, partial [Nitrosopumilus sp.]
SGPAISEKELTHLFEPLFTTKLEGTGLGLTSCKNIITRHNGTIHVQTKPVIFTIILPKKYIPK